MHNQPDFNPTAGMPETLAPGLRRILAPNPSPMTYRGTNSYLLGQDEIAVIDPGPEDPAHFAALVAAIGGARVSHILVTHAHLDHSPLSRRLSQATGAPVLAYGDAQAGRSAIMQELAAQGQVGGGEGTDHEFRPDSVLKDGEEIVGDGWSLRAIHTPGHFGNHMSFAWDDIVFSGDIVMGWASSLVSPPDGDLGDFMRSCARLRSIGAAQLLPGHGAPVKDPHARIDWLIGHRKSRERAILDALQDGPADAASLATRIYSDTPPELLGAAARNVLAHLVDLTERAEVKPTENLHARARFQRN